MKAQVLKPKIVTFWLASSGDIFFRSVISFTTQSCTWFVITKWVADFCLVVGQKIGACYVFHKKLSKKWKSPNSMFSKAIVVIISKHVHCMSCIYHHFLLLQWSGNRTQKLRVCKRAGFRKCRLGKVQNHVADVKFQMWNFKHLSLEMTLRKNTQKKVLKHFQQLDKVWSTRLRF